ncbi:MAG: hypothetical protein IID40_02445, partial [Planctomycetes bacterium]|nr:hypothetical protein [Planctomycetota bacterium]
DFKEQHLVTRADVSKPFDLQEYYDHPDRYRADFFRHLPHLTLLVNCIYWEPKYPRLITNEQLAELYDGDRGPRLRVIGEITCDVEGSIECLVRCTDPGNPVYVFEAATGLTHDGVAGRGPVVLGVDFLPCELPVDSSVHFSRSMSPWIPAIAGADFTGSLSDSGLPPELVRATILWRGQLTEPYRYLHEFVE